MKSEGVAERKFREREEKRKREVEYSSVQMMKDFEMVKQWAGLYLDMRKRVR